MEFALAKKEDKLLTCTKCLLTFINHNRDYNITKQHIKTDTTLLKKHQHLLQKSVVNYK